MEIATLRFGALEVEEDRVIRFTSGIPPFTDVLHYVLVARTEELPFQWLQAVDDPELAFVVADPLVFFPDYAPAIAPADRQELGLGREEAVQVLVLLVVSRSAGSIMANLLAPVVINPQRQTAKQIVTDGGLDLVRVPLPIPQADEVVAAVRAAG